jgi:hypothetical protein
LRLSFERHPEKRREVRTLPASFYNMLKVAFAASCKEAIFIPIRSLQYLAIVDREEVIFVDRHHSRYVELAWQHFRPDLRESIDDPVDYECVVYEDFEDTILQRLQGEFFQALKSYREKNLPQPDGEARVLPLKPCKPDRS